MRRTQLKRSTTPRRRIRVKPASLIQADIWRENLGPCAVCRTPTFVDGHHIIYAQTLRDHGLHDYLMDKRNRLALCRAHHEAHHNRSQPVPREALPASVFEFAEEVGLGWYLDRHYPVIEAQVEGAA